MGLLQQLGGRLYRKYVVYFAAMIGAVILAGASSDLYSSYYKTRDTTIALNREKAAAAAIRIEQFVREIKQHVGWSNLLQRSSDPLLQRQIEFIKLLRQAPAITDAIWLDANGREQLRVSRLAMDQLHSGKDFSLTPAFQEARKRSPYHGPVYFREGTEPYTTIAVAAGDGVTLVEVNLKFVWDVINNIRFGQTGYAYVVDAKGQLISHPDISLVLKNTDMSSLPQVQQALAIVSEGTNMLDVGNAYDLSNRAVIAVDAPVALLGWSVLVEQDKQEAFAPLYSSMKRTAFLMLLGLLLALGTSALLARRMVRPIQALQQGAARLGAGELGQRIEVHTRDELETLAEEFNHMAKRLRESYASLEQKVVERTEELVAANRAKSRFLAAASHDLRQPMHALGLFVAQLNNIEITPEAKHLAGRINAAVTALQGLLDALLDVSRLDAGVITPNMGNVPINHVLEHIENTFAAEATAREIHFRVVRSKMAVHSDPILLERILINLVANAMRYTEHGGILVGCRRRGEQVRIEVWDTGIGIAPEHQQAIFQEFYQVDNPERDRKKGLGLGLSIASRLARLLNGRIILRSIHGKGSVFSVQVPRSMNVLEPVQNVEPVTGTKKLDDALILVVDDDVLVRESIEGMITQWGCRAITSASGEEALARMNEEKLVPNAVICDYRLPRGETGIEVIKQLCNLLGQEIPAALITGDTNPELLREAKEHGFMLMHKPLQPARLRMLLEHLLSE